MNQLKKAGLLVVALLAAVAILYWAALRWYDTAESQSPPDAKKSQASPLVLVVDERDAVTKFGEEGEKPPARVTEPLHRLFPSEDIDWRFRGIDPTRPDDLANVVQQLNPRVVVLLNESFLPSVRSRSFPCSFVVASELPKYAIEVLYRDDRERRRMSFISWYSTAQAKWLEHLATLNGRPIHKVAAFLARDLIDGGVDRELTSLAHARGIEMLIVKYADFEDFARRLQAVAAEQAPDGLIIPVANEMIEHFSEASRLVAATRRPASYSRQDQVDGGGLVATAPPKWEIYDQIVRYVVLILHGADPTRLEVAVPSRLQTSLNLAAARESGLVVPFELLIEAAEIRDE